MGKPQGVTLKPQLTLFDAIVTGLAAILGAGIFTVIAPATGLAGPAILVSFGIAAFVAFCNASSSIQLAAVFPRSGGTYEFGRRMLGNWWGFIAGWMFLLANTVGPGVSALAFGSYLHAVWPVIPFHVAAIGAAAVMVILDAAGIQVRTRNRCYCHFIHRFPANCHRDRYPISSLRKSFAVCSWRSYWGSACHGFAFLCLHWI